MKFVAICSLLVVLGTVPSSVFSLELDLSHNDRVTVDRVLEAMLAPSEFKENQLVYNSSPEDAFYLLDVQYQGDTVDGKIHPERVRLPEVAGLPVKILGEPLTMTSKIDHVSDEDLDAGFMVKWVLISAGHRFEPKPHFAVKIQRIEVVSSAGKTLFSWTAPLNEPVCRAHPKKGQPRCVFEGVGREARAVALSPDGDLLALALGGMRPRLEMYRVTEKPVLIWQALFSTGSGGVVETAFSSDGGWVVALTGDGRMHRFDAHSGGKHLMVASRGLTARALPPGDVMAVGGKKGAVTLWYLADGTIAWRITPKRARGSIDRLAASGDGGRIATLEYDKSAMSILVWEVNKRRQLVQVEMEPYSVTDIALNSDGTVLFITHESRGLLSLKVHPAAQPIPVTGQVAPLCKNRLMWAEGTSNLSCTLPDGVVGAGKLGKKQATRYFTPTKSSDWIVTTAAGGGRLAAVGAGYLVIW